MHATEAHRLTWLHLFSVYVQKDGGEISHLKTMKEGVAFGEIAIVFPNLPRTATIIAASFCEMQVRFFLRGICRVRACASLCLVHRSLHMRPCRS